MFVILWIFGCRWILVDVGDTCDFSAFGWMFVYVGDLGGPQWIIMDCCGLWWMFVDVGDFCDFDRFMWF